MASATGVDMDKRSPITLRTIAFGSLIGILYIFLGVYVSLKTGVAFIGGVSILGFILLSVKRVYEPKENVVVTTIIQGTICASAGVVATLPALVIFAGRTLYNTPITIELIFTLSIFGGVLGLFLLLPFREQLLKMPWPQAVPIYKTIETLGAEPAAKNRLLKWMGISSVYIGGVLGIGHILRSDLTVMPQIETLPTWWTRLTDFSKTWNPSLYSNLSTTQSAYQFIGQAMAPYPLPSFMGISNSPLIACIGYFIGWKRSLMLFLGGIYSVLIWMLFENQYFGQPGRFVDYGSHINLPQIFYLAMGILIAFLSWGIIKGVKDWQNNRRKILAQTQFKNNEQTPQPEEAKTATKLTPISRFEQIKIQLKHAHSIIREWFHLAVTRYKLTLIVLAIFFVGSLLMFYVFQPFPNVQINPWFLLLSCPALFISSWWTAIAVSETGFMSGFLTDLLAVPAILGFDINFPSLIVFFTLMTVIQATALRVIGAFKVGREIKVKDRTVFLSILYGVLFGAVLGSLIIFLLYQTYGFGTSNLPAPTATITGIFFLSFLQFKTPVFQPGTMLAFQGLTIIQISQQMYLGLLSVITPNSFELHYTKIFFTIGLIVGLLLLKYNLSPISFLVGVLIPPMYSFSILLGGGLNYYVYRKNKHNLKDYLKKDTEYHQSLSGVSAGEGLVYLVWILLTTTIMMFGF
ncbi:MAG: OPT/YSL family transporter [Candidatus Jordarchaeum sp.]|uniref:OPT/YSL family transporter n=1 Tax=Candidatus Jordarchaeum sp. TaxID=2823881 RepID=UPI0040499308